MILFRKRTLQISMTMMTNQMLIIFHLHLPQKLVKQKKKMSKVIHLIRKKPLMFVKNQNSFLVAEQEQKLNLPFNLRRQQVLKAKKMILVKVPWPRGKEIHVESLKNSVVHQEKQERLSLVPCLVPKQRKMKSAKVHIR